MSLHLHSAPDIDKLCPTPLTQMEVRPRTFGEKIKCGEETYVHGKWNDLGILPGPAHKNNSP